MKALSKPLSSPSRAEKFPPPLMRFLRSNVGSRSRGRSRSSPMFYLRSRKTAAAAIETTQEPSSPKVTCIGQVRVRRSKTVKRRRRSRRCWWLKKTLFCPGFLRRRKNPLGGMFCKCGSFFGWGYCRKVDTRDSLRVYSNSKSGKSENHDVAVNNGNCSSDNSERDYMNKYENHGAGSQENKRGFLESSSSSSSPPKNALMLTRCRSAPYRSSSLGGRFWGSPLAEKDDENGGKSLINVDEEEEADSSKEMEMNAAEAIQEIKKLGGGGGGGAVHPLLLTRCKSEPARTGERLIINAEPILLRQTRLADDDDVVQPRSHQNS